MMFSILMCTYNSAETVKAAIASVKEQEDKDWQLMILDNGSVDGTPQILQKFAAEDERIHCLYRTDNVGWCKGISICLEKAAGEYMMFLGADDMLASRETLADVRAVIMEHQPEIIWTGFRYAQFQNGEHFLAEEHVCDYRIYNSVSTDKLTQLAELMGEHSYYNSVMHYVRIDFLRQHQIDFFAPYYGDCQGMTEAICRADRMVVLDKVEYILTANTSQTATKVGYDYDVSCQWNSVKAVLPELELCEPEKLRHIAERILRNLAAMLEEMVTGAELRDAWMHPVQKGFADRFLKAEEWISTEAFGEMLYYAQNEVYAEQMIGAAGVLYWHCKKYPAVFEEIQIKSVWLADFIELVLEQDSQGRICWKAEGQRNVTKLLYAKEGGCICGEKGENKRK